MTVFVGQCFVDDKGKETLKTMWLLREEVSSPGADWKATRWVTGHRLPRSEGLELGLAPSLCQGQGWDPGSGPRAPSAGDAGKPACGDRAWLSAQSHKPMGTLRPPVSRWGRMKWCEPKAGLFPKAAEFPEPCHTPGL